MTINSTGVLFAASNSAGIFRSEDNGESWTGFNNGLTVLNVRSLAINSLGNVFAGTTDGIFISSDNGDNWTEVNFKLLVKNLLPGMVWMSALFQ